LKIVIDTNVAFSGLLWGGAPNRLLKLCRDDVVVVVECDDTIQEVKSVLQYPKFSTRLSALGITAMEAFAYFMNIVTYVPPPKNIPNVIRQDPFDNSFLGLAAENGASLIVSGDNHLLSIENYKNIQIVTPSEGVSVISSFLE
jgi:uncharacterized protein